MLGGGFCGVEVLEDSDWSIRYLMTSSSEVLLPFVMVKTVISVCVINMNKMCGLASEEI